MHSRADPRASVTALDPDPRREGSVRVTLGGRPFLTVGEEVIAETGLTLGRVVDEACHERLCRGADQESALRAALVALARRPWARQDLCRRLIRRGHPPVSAEGAIRRLDVMGLLDDEAFARTYVQVRAARGLGAARLRRDLAHRGVEAVVIDRALAGELPEGDEADEVARRLARARAARLADLPRATRLRRVVAYLARRGFAGQRFRRMVREALG